MQPSQSVSRHKSEMVLKETNVCAGAKRPETKDGVLYKSPQIRGLVQQILQDTLQRVCSRVAGADKGSSMMQGRAQKTVVDNILKGNAAGLPVDMARLASELQMGPANSVSCLVHTLDACRLISHHVPGVLAQPLCAVLQKMMWCTNHATLSKCWKQGALSSP